MLVAFLPGEAFAGHQGGYCTPTDTTRLIAWENVIGDTSDGNDNIDFCGNVTNLDAISHTLPGDCHSVWFPPQGTWNDCISSVTLWVPSGWLWCGYINRDYGLFNWQRAGPLKGVRQNLGSEEQLSSFKFTSNSTCN